MVKILANRDTSELEISSYNGNSGETIKYPVTFERLQKRLNFFREGNNHSYVGGEITYKRGCGNNLVVSPYNINFLRDIENAFIFVENSFVEISPIYDLTGIVGRLRYHLVGNKVDYNIPISVLNRETLVEKCGSNLEKVLNESYGIVPKEIAPIPSKSKRGGIFYLVDGRGKKYVFKFKNKKEDRAEMLSEIVESIPGFFPRNYSRLDTQRYTGDMGDGWYGVESFVEGGTKERNLEYFSLMGKNIEKLHQEFEHFLRNRSKIDGFLDQPHSSLSESNLLSLYLDIFIDNSDEFFLSELEGLIHRDFSSKARSLQQALIHRDLNQSNILWVENNPIIIDSESIGISEKLNEFIPALLLQGNRNRPSYVPNSMDSVLRFYRGLSPEEELILPDLLKYSLIRYYVIRNIRRDFGESTELEKIKSDLNQINLET